MTRPVIASSSWSYPRTLGDKLQQLVGLQPKQVLAIETLVDMMIAEAMKEPRATVVPMPTLVNRQ